MPPNNPYKLSQQENTEHFQNVRLPFLMATSSPVDAPVFVLIGGQSGAGKSSLAALIEATFVGNAVTLDADLFRPAHPCYGVMLKECPADVFELSRDDVNAWLKQAGDFAQSTRRNVVMDGTLRDREHIAELAKSYRAAGYRIELNIMATHERFSQASIFKRYEDGLASQTKAGRYVAPEFHKATYSAVPITLKHLEKNKLIDTVRIWNRDNEVIYENTLINGEWENQASAVVFLEAERNREANEQEIRALQKTRDKVISMMREREATLLELDSVCREFAKFPIPLIESKPQGASL